MKFVMTYIRKEEWSPYAAGILLGLVGIATVWASNALLGASGAFENLAGMIGKAIAPKAFDNMYFNFIMPPGITWGLILLIGVFFGGMIGAATSDTLLWGKKGAANSDTQWKRIFGPQVWKRWVLARSFWNTRLASPAAVPADLLFLAACCWRPRLSYSSWGCLLQASSRRLSFTANAIRITRRLI
jgi:hypothetical protein